MCWGQRSKYSFAADCDTKKPIPFIRCIGKKKIRTINHNRNTTDTHHAANLSISEQLIAVESEAECPKD